ncbi:MAG: hypothetical protein ISQ38_00445 [Alphaproteobacteria bacterium]|nr:hypothetical protein [Alphaproteobacteria bacterium]
MQIFYLRVFDFIDNAKPTHLGIYFSLFFHLSILLFAIGLPDFFKPNKIPMPQIIPIEILNVSDVTSLAPKKETLETNKIESKKIKQKKFNSSENTEIQKIDIQEKPKKNIVQNENKTDNTFVTPKLETKKINISKKEKITKLETIKQDKIKPKLKPKPIEKIEPKSDMIVQNKIKPEIKKNEEKKTIDKPKPIQKPQPDFNIASVLKDLRNEEVSNIIEDDSNEKKLENNEEDTNIKESLEVSISEMDLVIQQLRSCFNPRAGTQIIGDEMVKISAKIDRAANVRKDTVQIIDTNISKSNPYYKAITESAVATLYNPLCSQLKLPLNKYESWKDLKITIDYSWIKN